MSINIQLPFPVFDALRLHFQDDYIRNKFIEYIKDSISNPKIVKHITQLYDNNAGDENFIDVLHKMKIPDRNINGAIFFYETQSKGIVNLVHEFPKFYEEEFEEDSLFFPDREIYLSNLSNEVANSEAKLNIMSIFDKTDNIFDFKDGISDLIFFEELDKSSGKNATKIFSHLFPTSTATIVEDSQKKLTHIKTNKMIKKFVGRYLFPFIANFKQETDLGEEKPVPFYEQLRLQFPNISESKLIRVGLEAYIHYGAKGLDTNNHVNVRLHYTGKKVSQYYNNLSNPYYDFSNSREAFLDYEQMRWFLNVCPNHVFKPFSRAFLIFLQALFPAIEKDFPQLKITSTKLTEMAIKALEKVNRKRKAEFIVQKIEHSKLHHKV